MNILKMKCIYKRELVAKPLAIPLLMVLDEIITKMCVSGDVLDEIFTNNSLYI
jgi:hypothetical protein